FRSDGAGDSGEARRLPITAPPSMAARRGGGGAPGTVFRRGVHPGSRIPPRRGACPRVSDDRRHRARSTARAEALGAPGAGRGGLVFIGPRTGRDRAAPGPRRRTAMTGQDRNEEARAGDERPTPITDRVKDREQTYGAWHPIGVARARADGR